ncbi:MAG TPA: hypothetical protein VLA93_09110 [Pyrinomonadaceae bacterium]|nr:hypothetical protein [Pyrinomonadaceae bacterium]
MTTRVIYRIAAVLILLFDLGHTAGYPWSDPSWGVDLGAIQSSHFKILGFTRTYWNFYVGFGLFVSVFLLLAAIFAWQLSSLPAETLRLMRSSAWALSICFAAVTVLSWMYFFTIPIAFSGVITVCLIVATWRSARAAKRLERTRHEQASL